jgi:hypothetical protein
VYELLTKVSEELDKQIMKNRDLESFIASFRDTLLNLFKRIRDKKSQFSRYSTEL